MDRATQYCIDVLNGSIPAGKSIQLSCKRHLRDLERQGTDEFPYVWDIDQANDLIDFAETLTIAEGEEPQPLVCYPFQCFIFGSWNGWVHKDTGFRRFRTSYVEVARQNGKSIGNAVPALYYGNFAGYQYPQIYCVATKELQARIVVKECNKFINADPELRGTKTKKGFFTIKDYKSEIECNLTNGTIKALGKDTNSIDGFRPFFASVDEYHKHKTNQMYKLLTDGTKKLKQCLISVITTAGFDLNSPCKELRDYCMNVLLDVCEDETQFIYIAELDKEVIESDKIWDPQYWPHSNPLWTPETLESLKSDAIKARKMGGEELRNFMTKGLNIWVQFSDNQYLNIENWKKCESITTIDDMRGRECYLGIDLSKGGDLTSVAFEFPLFIDDQKKYFIESHSFIPKNRVEEHKQTDDAPYDMWIRPFDDGNGKEREGLLTVTETLGGVKTDYKYIITYCKNMIAEYDLKLLGIAYDPHNADAFLSDLEEFGVDCVEITQSARNLNDATEDFKLEVDAGNIIYDKRNKLLTWSAVNAKKVSNSFGEIKIDKDLKTRRIDPIAAVVDAHKLAMKAEDSTPVYENGDEIFSV